MVLALNIPSTGRMVVRRLLRVPEGRDELVTGEGDGGE